MKKRQNPFKKAALSCTNTPAPPRVMVSQSKVFVLRDVLSSLCCFPQGQGLGARFKECCQQLGHRLSVLTSVLPLTWERACPCSLAVHSVDPNQNPSNFVKGRLRPPIHNQRHQHHLVNVCRCLGLSNKCFLCLCGFSAGNKFEFCLLCPWIKGGGLLALKELLFVIQGYSMSQTLCDYEA